MPKGLPFSETVNSFPPAPALVTSGKIVTAKVSSDGSVGVLLSLQLSTMKLPRFKIHSGEQEGEFTTMNSVQPALSMSRMSSVISVPLAGRLTVMAVL